LFKWAAPERVAEAMHDSFPSAPMYTTVALPNSLPQRLRMADIRTSPLQHLPSIERRFRHYFMLTRSRSRTSTCRNTT